MTQTLAEEAIASNPYGASDPEVESPFPEYRKVDSLHDLPDFGLESGTRNIKQWYMIVQEDTGLMNRNERITGQFTPQQVTQNIGAQIPEAGGFSRPSPIIQWVGGQLRTLSLSVRLFSEHKEDHTAAVKLAKLEKLVDEYHRETNRPPIVAFFWGVAFPDGISCMVESLGGVSYDEIRPDGTLRGVTLSMTLKKHSRYIFEQAALPGLEQTPVHIAKHGETYEMIAKRHYGDPMIGVLLRQLNPRAPMNSSFPTSVADLSAGDKVKIFPVDDMNREKVGFLCHLLRQDNFLSVNNRRRFFELRSTAFAALPRK